jgi:hypothetical protein
MIMVLKGYCPHLAALRIRQVRAEGRSVWLDADVSARDAGCPDCGSRSARVHSRYQRVLADPAIGGRPTLVRVRVRRFFCDNTACRRRTFAEQVPQLTTPYARRTPLLRSILEKIAVALGGRPGARMTRLLAAEVSRTTLLRPHRAPTTPDLTRRRDQADCRGAGHAEATGSDRLDHPARRRAHRLRTGRHGPHP